MQDLPDPDIILKIEEANKWKNDRLNLYEQLGEQLDKLWHDIDNGTLTNKSSGTLYLALKTCGVVSVVISVPLTFFINSKPVAIMNIPLFRRVIMFH